MTGTSVYESVHCIYSHTMIEGVKYGVNPQLAKIFKNFFLVIACKAAGFSLPPATEKSGLLHIQSLF